MGTEIKIWQINDGKLEAVNVRLSDGGRTEPFDLEPWIASNASILGPDIVIIGKQVMSKSGPMDILGIDKIGNPIIVELKRDKLPREVLAQAIDYASDVADWTLERLSEISLEFTGKTLEEIFNESFSDVDIENLNINQAQRIILVGFSIESSLERMIEWLSDRFNVNINAIVLKYIKTSKGDELLAKTSIISEEIDQERVQKRKRFQIPMSDDPGNYDEETLKNKLRDYLSESKVTSQRIKEVLLPGLLEAEMLTRNELKEKFLEHDPNVEPSKVGYHLTTISTQLGMKKNDYLRQIISYEYPNYEWEKDNFSLRKDYKELVGAILLELNN